MSELQDEANRALQVLVGPQAEFRPDQFEAIEALVADRRRVLVVQRTGWGKSAVYFVATRLLRARGAGPTLLVSPLLSLMRNQIEAGERGGVRAARITSDNTDDWEKVVADLDADRVDLLLVSPERFANPEFRDNVLPKLAARAGLLVIDEAHCISDWVTTSAPTTAASRASSTCCRRACRCCARPRPRTTGSSTTSSTSSVTTCSCCGAPSTG